MSRYGPEEPVDNSAALLQYKKALEMEEDAEKERYDAVLAAIGEDAKLGSGKTAFLVAFAETDNITEACRASGFARQTHYDWLAADPLYVAAFARAREIAADILKREAFRRAVEGNHIPVFYRGEVVGIKRERSDELLMFLLKGALPEVYNKRIEVSGKIQHNVVVSQVTSDMLGLEGEDLLAAMKKRISDMKLGVAADDAPQNRPGLLTLPGVAETLEGSDKNAQ